MDTEKWKDWGVLCKQAWTRTIDAFSKDFEGAGAICKAEWALKAARGGKLLDEDGQVTRKFDPDSEEGASIIRGLEESLDWQRDGAHEKGGQHHECD